MLVHARAPLRIDFAGGWTDAPPFAAREGGHAVTAAISLAVHADFLVGDQRIRLSSEDLEERVSVPSSGAIAYDGRLDIHKAALNMLPVTGGIEVVTRSDAPLGSGLGVAGALEVAILAGLASCREEGYEQEDLAELGHQLETLELKWPGGRQDQCAAAYGGVQSLAFGPAGTAARRVELDPERREDLAAHTLLVFSGPSHFTADARLRVWEACERGNAAVLSALRAMDGVARAVPALLEAGEWQALAAAISEHWEHQRELDTALAAPRAEAIETAVLGTGAWGLKGTGPGAGGCLVILAPPERHDAVAHAAEDAGGRVLPFAFVPDGVSVGVEEPPTDA